jgi:ankyrin repeat protein
MTTQAPLTKADIHSDANLEGMAWWFGDVTREAAEDLLLSLDRDTFLVRSSSRPGCYACSLYDAATGQIDHTLVVRTGTGGFKFAKKSAAAAQEYGSLVELILSSPLLSAYAAPDPGAADDPVSNARKANERRARLKPQVTGAQTLRGSGASTGGSTTLKKPLREWETERSEADTKILLEMEQLLGREIPILQKAAEQLKRKQTQFFPVPPELKKLHVNRHPPPDDGESLVQMSGNDIVPAADGLHLFTAMDRIDHTTVIKVPEDEISQKDRERFWRGELPSVRANSESSAGPRKRLSTWISKGSSSAHVERPAQPTQPAPVAVPAVTAGGAPPVASSQAPISVPAATRPAQPEQGSFSGDYATTFPLHAAVERGDKKLVKKLLGNDTRLWETLNDSRETPLIVALSRCAAMVPVLLKIARKLGPQKIDLNKKIFGDGSALLHMAMQTATRGDAIQMLLREKSLNVGVRNDRDNTALHYFAQYFSGADYSVVLDSLLEQGGIVLARTPNASGETPLHRTVLNNNTETGAGIADILIKRVGRELVNHRNKRRATALHFACSMNRPKIVELLLPLADLSAVTADGRTAAQIAEQSQFHEILQLFARHSTGQPNQPNQPAAMGGASSHGLASSGSSGGFTEPVGGGSAPSYSQAAGQPAEFDPRAADQAYPGQVSSGGFDPRAQAGAEPQAEAPSNPFFNAPEEVNPGMGSTGGYSSGPSQGNVDDVSLEALVPERQAPAPPPEAFEDSNTFDGLGDAPVVPAVAAPAPPGEAGPDMGIVMWDYEGRTEDELTVPADAQVVIVQRWGFDASDNAWFRLEYGGRQGFVPSNYVQPLS